MSRIKIMVVDDVDETREVISKILKLEKERFEVVGTASNGKEAVERVAACHPDIVLMDINMPVMNGLEATEAITEKYPEVSVIIMSVQAESEYLKKAMFCGAKEYIIKPIDYDTLINTLESTYNKFKDRAVQVVAAKEEPAKSARIMAVYSGKGGVGKSVIASNLAVVLSEWMHKKTLLIDLDLQYGDLALMMNLNNKKTILDLVDDHQLESMAEIMPYLSSFNKDLDVLPAPRSPEGGEYIGKEPVQKLLEQASTQYDFIIVDTGVNFDEEILYVLDQAERIFVVTTMELTAVKSTKLTLNVMRTLNYPDSKVQVILNAQGDGYGVTEKEVAEVFKNNLAVILPQEDKLIKTSVNKGTPAAAGNMPKIGGSKFVKRMQELAKKTIE